MIISSIVVFEAVKWQYFYNFSDYVFTGIVDSKLDFDVMNYSDIGNGIVILQQYLSFDLVNIGNRPSPHFAAQIKLPGWVFLKFMW